MSNINLDIRSKDIESAYVVEPFDKGLEILKKADYEIISSRDNASLRIQQGKNYGVSINGNWVREGLLSVKNSDNLLALNSPLLDTKLAKQAAEANMKGEYLSTEDLKLYEQYLRQAEKDRNKDPKERQVLIIPRDYFSISPKENSEIFEALFKDIGKIYLSFIGQDSLRICPIDKQIVDDQNGTLLTQLWFAHLNYRSRLVGIYKFFFGCSSLRGIRYVKSSLQSLEESL
ncbi:MAG: hypothetical protein V1663_05120 [archaeon]